MEQRTNRKHKALATDVVNTKDSHIPLLDESFEFLLLFIGHGFYSIFNSSSSAYINGSPAL
jgi:hypothetical protein